MDSLTITTEQSGPAVLIRLEGAADMTAAQELRRQFDTLIQNGHRILVVDLAGLNFICSMGLGSLIYSHHHCRAHQGGLILLNPKESIQILMQTTQLDQFFTICTKESLEHTIREIISQ